MRSIVCPNGCNGTFDVTVGVDKYKQVLENPETLGAENFKCSECNAIAVEEEAS